MSKLFVANATRQKIEFHFRVPEVANVIVVPIGIGQQVRIYRDDLTGPEVNALVEQLVSGWGARPVSEIDRADDFVGVCYSIDTPVKSAKIEAAVEHNLDVLTKRGEEFRKETAVAINHALQEATPEARLIESDMTIREETKPGETPKINETIEVREPGNEKPAPRRRGKR